MNQGDAIDHNEVILRRVPARADYYNSTLPIPLIPIAFRPTCDDTDGISLFRERHISREELSATGRKPPYLIARLKVADVVALGLTITQTPSDDGTPGHVIIPELSLRSYNANKQQSSQRTDRSIRPRLVDIDAAADRIPSLKPAAIESEVLEATGTDGRDCQPAVTVENTDYTNAHACKSNDILPLGQTSGGLIIRRSGVRVASPVFFKSLENASLSGVSGQTGVKSGVSGSHFSLLAGSG